MRLFHQLGLLAGVGFALFACSAQDSTDQTTGSGGGGGSSGLVHCNIVYIEDACDACNHENCCAELTACAAVPYCFTCLINPWDVEPECTPNPPAANALYACETAHCAVPCGHIR